MLIEVSIGEVLDKLSILEIKKERITDPTKLKNITYEFDSLVQALNENQINFINEYDDLLSVNRRIWEAEESIRKTIDVNEVASLATSIHQFNDARAATKKLINLQYGSKVIEEKSYENS